ncbi:MAG: hypothetical protein ABI831_03510 [Betaproteobacteria bacterium]
MFGNESDGVVMAGNFVSGFAHRFEKRREFAKAFGQKLAIHLVVEQEFGSLPEPAGEITAAPQAYASLSPIVEKQFAEGRLEALGKGRFSPAPDPEPRQGEFNVFAGSQIVGGIVGTGAIVLARAIAANRYPVAARGFRVGYGKVGEHRVVPKILDPKILLAAKLPAQRALPVIDRQVHGLALSGKTRLGVRLCPRLLFARNRLGGCLVHGLRADVLRARFAGRF